MAANYDKLMNGEVVTVEQQLLERDTMLYALGVGLGADPMDEQQLQYVYEKDLKALPTMAIVLGYPGPWFATAEMGITPSHMVHGEQGFTIHKPLPVKGSLIGKSRVTEVVDKGADKGALIYTNTDVYDKASNDLVCTLHAATFCRKDGGWGGRSSVTKPVHPIPERAPDHVCDLATLPQAALIYRLSGDYNPLHAEPAYAGRAGFKAPILHGRATLGVAGHALLKAVCNYDASKFKSMDGRFSSPVYPGETIRTEIWVDGKRVTFRASVPARNVVVLNNGVAEIV